jgi:uncharacterized membrane protein (UPF0127 family)
VSSRAWSVTALVVAVAALLVACGSSGAQDRGRLHVAPARSADAPFGAFGETRLALGDRCLRVLVATTEVQRVQGLRDVQSLAPYDGMIFVYESDTSARFTMANTPLPLDISFFDADGKPVDQQRMTPCPTGTDATCPIYASTHRFRYALERAAGAAGGGALAACGA